MNRYTYKAKRKDNGEWITGYYWFKKDYVCFANEGKDKHYIRNQRNLDWGITDQIDYEIIPEKLCQCTGLQDIDGKDIFENDIVEYLEPLMETTKIIRTVEYKNGKYLVGNYVLYDKKDIKIIGNKFDKEVE